MHSALNEIGAEEKRHFREERKCSRRNSNLSTLALTSLSSHMLWQGTHLVFWRTYTVISEFRETNSRTGKCHRDEAYLRETFSVRFASRFVILITINMHDANCGEKAGYFNGPLIRTILGPSSLDQLRGEDTRQRNTDLVMATSIPMRYRLWK